MLDCKWFPQAGGATCRAAASADELHAPCTIGQCKCLYVQGNRKMCAFAQVGEGNLERRAIKAEKTAMRMMLYPVMQAEEDRRRVAHCPGKAAVVMARATDPVWWCKQADDALAGYTSQGGFQAHARHLADTASWQGV